MLVVVSLSTAGDCASMLQTLTGEWSGGNLSGTVTDSISGGVVLASGNTTGTVTSIPVAVDSRTFLSAECVTDEPDETAISVVLEGDSYGWSTVANVNTPGAFQEAINKRLDMTRLNLSGYNRIRLKATLTRTRLDRNPVLIEWRILYSYAGETQPTVYDFENVKGFSATEQIATTYSHSETHSIHVQGGTTLRSNRFPVQTGKHVGVDMWLYSPSDQLPQNLYVAVKGYASQAATELKAGVAYILTGGKLTANPYWTSVEPQSYAGQSSQAYLTARIIQNPLQAGRWYHFTGRSAKTDTNDWCGWGQYYAPEAWDNSGITHVEVEISANTGNVYLDDISIVNDVPVPDRSQSEMEYNSINLRPVWQKKYAEIETKLTDLRAEAASDQRYAVEVTETPGTVTLKRDVWQGTFSRTTASVTGAIMRGRPIQGFYLPDLILVDSAGSTYRQRYATNGALSVSQRQNDIVLTGKFTPKTSAGTPSPVTFGVTYKMSRLSGSVLCEMKILSGTVNAKYLSISHNLGIQKPPLRYGFVENMWNQGMGSGYPPPSYPYDNTSWEDTDSTTQRVVMAGPFPMASWSNQIYGVQVYPMTWNGAVVSDVYKGPQQDSYLVNMIDSSGAKDTRVTMVHTDTPATLSSGYKIANTFMVMPFRKYTPTNQSVVLGSVNFLTNQNGNVADPGVQAAFEEEVRKYAAEGVNTVITWYGTWSNDFWPGFVDKATRDITVATFHKYGIKVLMYFESSYVTGIHESMITGRHSLDELNRMYNKWYPHFLRPLDGYHPFSGQVWPCYNYKPSRLQLLTMLNDTLADSDIDGFYLDSDTINMCENPEHELTNAINNHLPGRLALHEELRLLLDDYGR
ncbi:MAG: hypothetical protein HY663_03525, partial [Chloroflexi bacterium]|nr:hypothetical protein [Chloroflexota bacterium]